MGQPHSLTQIIINWFPLILLAGAWAFLFTASRANQRKDVLSDAKEDKGAMLGSAILAVLAALALLSARNALSVPWSWSGNQIGAAALSAVVGIAILGLAWIWWSQGFSAVKARVALIGRQAPSNRPKSTSKTVLFFVIMVTIAVVLIFVVNWLKHLPA